MTITDLILFHGIDLQEPATTEPTTTEPATTESTITEPATTEPTTTESTTTEPATIQITLEPTTGITSTPEQSTENPDTLEKKRHIVRISIRAAGSVDVNDPRVHKAILDKVQELLSKQTPMSGSTLHWLEKDGMFSTHRRKSRTQGTLVNSDKQEWLWFVGGSCRSRGKRQANHWVSGVTSHKHGHKDWE
ncbi:hypothetical protein AOXY_G12847 [Acipenser oxyrinchus oxyrinchus]|uniref:Uncharacterized protein n=1 Tax=Acipenser oxyrinchus oxyrinchus TaxID=40147 RepID=A0AAD8G6Q3_ACIOX|nr:hypothetical protein AOXY_G12847 [Acipenser oxyrinchus oxyrinchus]